MSDNRKIKVLVCKPGLDGDLESLSQTGMIEEPKS
jgi:hypothetical protein